jgi:DNA-binding LacI/PurR family transcriptional regulator
VRSKVTIQHVADAVGVSTQTVSRVINKKPDVSKTTRTRVLEKIKEMGYEPNLLARGLASHKTFTLGLMMDDFSDPFYAQIIAAAEAEARRLDYFFLICSAERNPSDEITFLKIFSSRQVDGILLLALPSSEEQYQHIVDLREKGMPIVSIASHLLEQQISVVDIDNVDGGYQAASCLIRSGRRRIGTITGPIQNKATQDRTQGYRMALQEAGLPFSTTWISYGDWTYRSGFYAMLELLSKNLHLDGLFIQNDRMAMAAMVAIRQAGLEIPADIALVGYDDTPDAAFTSPPLTTIHQPAQELGRYATHMLIDLINDPDLSVQHTLLKTELIVRGSCSLANHVP